MAKVQIKSERITPFGGIFQVMEQFSRYVGPVIDKVLGLRCTSFGYQSFTADDKSILYLGAENTLYYPQSGASIGAFRAFFQLNGITAGEISHTRMFFGDDETLGIGGVTELDNHDAQQRVYDLNGRQVTMGQTKKGVYVVNGKKVIIK